MQVFPVAVFVLGLPILISCFLAFDELVLLERERHNAAWERDRRPFTFLRRRIEFDRSLRSGLATQKCCLTWSLRSPSWSRSDPEAAGLLRRHRAFVAAWCFLVVPAFAVAAVRSAFAGEP